MNNRLKTYSELLKFNTYEDRLNYLKMPGTIGYDTFGSYRYLNQRFYTSKEWIDIRNYVITRDNACDLALPGYEIFKKILIHHMNPITKEDIIYKTDLLLNPEYLICVTKYTHNLIHYGTDIYDVNFKERKPGDTNLW